MNRIDYKVFVVFGRIVCQRAENDKDNKVTDTSSLSTYYQRVQIRRGIKYFITGTNYF